LLPPFLLFFLLSYLTSLFSSFLLT
jgi:hypothetical protein